LAVDIYFDRQEARKPRNAKMKREYDFTDSIRNPYAKYFCKRVTLRLGTDVIEYFKTLANETGMPYQNLINLYLRDCAHSGKKLALKWVR
jgi:predicted DNA binding CopG/RHH family protein